MNMTTTMTTDELATALWGCKAAQVHTDAAQVVGSKVLYPDPSGLCSAVCPYTGTRVWGWAVKLLTGAEPVELSDHGNVIELHAHHDVTDRFGAQVSGREAAKLRAYLAAR